MKKMKAYQFIIVALIIVGSYGCKNRSAARSLEGTWNEVQINGVAVPEASQDKIVFGKCNGGSGKECDLTIIDAGGSTFNYEYTVIEKGETLRLKQSQGAISATSDHDIVELTDNSLTIYWKLGQGSNYTGVYQKQ